MTAAQVHETISEETVRQLSEELAEGLQRVEAGLEQPVGLVEFVADLSDRRFVDGCVYLRAHVTRGSLPSRAR